MARAWEAEFIHLWQAGTPQAAIAQALGIPIGTVKSRSHTLQQQGTIQPRPRGGLVPVQRPGQTIDPGAEHSADIGAGHGFDTAAVQRLDQLEVEVQGLTTLVQSLVERIEHQPGQTPVQITTLPPYPKGKAVRWNLWILDVIREEIASLAAQRGISPSQLVQEWLWKALGERRTAMP
jgi:hypothetical protein